MQNESQLQEDTSKAGGSAKGQAKSRFGASF